MQQKKPVARIRWYDEPSNQPNSSGCIAYCLILKESTTNKFVLQMYAKQKGNSIVDNYNAVSLRSEAEDRSQKTFY